MKSSKSAPTAVAVKVPLTPKSTVSHPGPFIQDYRQEVQKLGLYETNPFVTSTPPLSFPVLQSAEESEVRWERGESSHTPVPKLKGKETLGSSDNKSSRSSKSSESSGSSATKPSKDRVSCKPSSTTSSTTSKFTVSNTKSLSVGPGDDPQPSSSSSSKSDQSSKSSKSKSSSKVSKSSSSSSASSRMELLKMINDLQGDIAAMKLSKLQMEDKARELQVTTFPYSPFLTKDENRPDVLALKSSCEILEAYQPTAKIPNLDLPSLILRILIVTVGNLSLG